MKNKNLIAALVSVVMFLTACSGEKKLMQYSSEEESTQTNSAEQSSVNYNSECESSDIEEFSSQQSESEAFAQSQQEVIDILDIPVTDVNEFEYDYDSELAV